MTIIGARRGWLQGKNLEFSTLTGRPGTQNERLMPNWKMAEESS